MPAKHQWLVNPQAIEVWAHTAPALCSEPKCYLAAKYQVAFPRQAPVLFCSRHTKLTIRRAIGQVADLGKMLAATAERDGQVLRRGAHLHVHWPQGARADDQIGSWGHDAEAGPGLLRGLRRGALPSAGDRGGHVPCLQEEDAPHRPAGKCSPGY